MLFCGAPDDPATPPTEQANVYATLTELNHFADPAIPFSAQYGTDGPRLVDEGAAFDNTYLLTLAHRTPEGRRDAMAHLGSYLFHELTTPLGLRLERTPHRSASDRRRSAASAPTRLVPARPAAAPGGPRAPASASLEEWQAATLDDHAVIRDKSRHLWMA